MSILLFQMAVIIEKLKGALRKFPTLYLNLKMIKWSILYGPQRAIQLKKLEQCSILYGPRRAIQSRKLERWEFSRLFIKRNWPNERELSLQRKTEFDRDIKFSILVPLYNTSEIFLNEMIQSVLNQTYENWELCLSDSSDGEHQYVKNVCSTYQKKDARIRYQKQEKNLGISKNTNICLDMANGDYVALLDHDDLLHPAALYEVMQEICENDADFIYTDEIIFQNKPKDGYKPHFKPDYAPDTLCSYNYICHLTVFKRSLIEQVGRFDPKCDGSQDHDMFLRLTEVAEKIVHIPQILYYWRAQAGSVAKSSGQKPHAVEAGIHAVEKHLKRSGLAGQVSSVSPTLCIYHIRYEIIGAPKVSILIPNSEHIDDLRMCLDSIFKKTTYSNYEIVIVENNSVSPDIFDYYERVQKEHTILRVIEWTGAFNYSAINNYGAHFCSGEYILLLNNDTEIITPDWIQEMLMFAQREDVGAVGAKLYYPDDTIQHAGVILGLGGVADHAFKGEDRKNVGYMGRLIYAQDVTAVTGACLMVRRVVWNEICGLDEEFAVAFNDVDLCMRIRKAGYLIVWTPFAELYHYESKSRGVEDTPEKLKRFSGEIKLFQKRWAKELEAGDPYFRS